MGADVPISSLLEKLNKLKDVVQEGLIYPGLRNHVHVAIDELLRIRNELEEAEDTSTLLPTVYSPHDTTTLLHTVYYSEFLIETFLLNTPIQCRQDDLKNLTKNPPLMAFPIPPWTQLRFSSKLKNIVKSLKAVHSEPRPRRDHPAINYKTDDDDDDDDDDDELVGFEDVAKDLVDRLISKQKSLRVISLVSEEAMGKTALVRKVYNRLDIRQYFKCRVWLHVPKNIECKDLLIVLLKQIPMGVLKGVELMSKDELSALLFQTLMELRFLIVLDDVSSFDVWLMLACPFADAANGSRVILTTRYSKIASDVDPWSRPPLELKPFTDKLSWELFLNKFRVGRHCHTDTHHQLDSYKVKILQICGGLPPAIVLLGRLLSSIQSNELFGGIDYLLVDSGKLDQSPLSNIIALCFRELRSELKLCFLYLALFPKEYEISVQRLLQLWIAEGFVKTSSTQQPEDIASKYLKELVRRNMIEIATRKEDGRHKTCRMPSFLHDFFFPKSKDIGFIHSHHCKANCTSIDSSAQPNIASPADQPNTDSPAQPNNVCLSDVCFKAQKRGTFNKEINEFLETIIDRRRSRGFALMKVLDLEGAHRPWLHVKLGKFLSNLRYISLRWTGVDSCPESIVNLPCLETLDLKYTNITNLSSSIWKAKNLRHLLMNEVSIPKPSSSKQSSTSMSNIQTLTGLLIGFEDPKEYGLNGFTNLRKLGLTCHSTSSVGKPVDCISQLNKLQTFKLRSRDHQFGQPSEFKIHGNLTSHPSLSNLYLFGVFKGGNLPENLKTLTLSMTKIEEDQMRELGQRLPQLNILRLFADSFVGEKMNCLGGGFPKLRVLKLWMLETLKEWIVEEGAMPELEELEIRGCEKLEKSQGLERLSHLKELTLTNMKREFVEHVKQNLASMDRSHILLTNDFKSSTSLA
ncbi:Disease resistance protein RPP13 [Camellia lanceoleosa]|uniref:Disease resistance protein RPP13 n=1 Tax=Camellia lanceoleosa TaxID=1840588 RepID=A0ACC0HS60_9ERIC|nr:Disease resistance protein RPP13 [Camellia lanceoleosa]